MMNGSFSLFALFVLQVKVKQRRNNFHWRLRLLMVKDAYSNEIEILHFNIKGICDFYERFDKLSTSGYRVMDLKRENGRNCSSLVGTSER